jgi:alkylation response protein AidB-like acyl-CoA dehydrogenase
MRLGDSEDQARFRAQLRGWLRAHVPPAQSGAPRVWEAEELRSWSKALWHAGYAGITWPGEHGGRGLSPAYQAIYAEESALAEAPDHVNVIGLNMVGPTIVRYGTQQQRARHLPRILSGETIFCQGFSEPDAGSDLASVRTRARQHPGGYQLDGEKVWSSYAHLADYCLLLARTNPDAPKHRGLTCFLLDMNVPGVQVRPLRQLSGDNDFNQIILTGVVIPASSVLGEVGDGWRVALTTLAHERGTFGITLTARLSVQLDRLVQTAIAVGAERDPVVRREIAELHVALHGLRFTGYRALAALERTGEPGPESSVLKLRWSQANQRLSALALRLLGAKGTIDGPTAFWGGYWQHVRLRARANSIEGGTSEILRSIIAERVLGLPRGRS